jgi:endonuclease-8
MPEGPEIRRMVDDIGKAVAGKTAEQVFFAFDRFKAFESTLTGREVTSVEARGKAVLVHFAATDDDGPWCVYSHNQLYGKWRIGWPNRPPDTNRQLRFAVTSRKKAARLYSASDILVVRPEGLAELGYLKRLGPDPLNQPTGVDDLVALFEDRRFAGRALGGLLLDQGFVAGIGNYLRSEILFEARIAPATRPRDLDPVDRERLAQAIEAATGTGWAVPRPVLARMLSSGMDGLVLSWLTDRDNEAAEAALDAFSTAVVALSTPATRK